MTLLNDVVKYSAIRRSLESLIASLRRFARALLRNSEIADDLVRSIYFMATICTHGSLSYN
jgi:DNA-directed RNA polymerase specialized sigma24 family protein